MGRDRNRPSRRGVLSGLSTLCAAATARAEILRGLPPPASLTTGCARMFDEQIKPAFLRVFNAEERAIFDQIDMRFSPDDAKVDDCYAAVTREGRRYVRVGAAYLLAQFQVSRAIVVAGTVRPPTSVDDEASLTVLQPFMAALTAAVVEHARQGPRAGGFVVVPLGSFLGLSEDQVDEIIARRQLAGVMIQMMIEGLAFIMAHEVGHHVHGDVFRRVDAAGARAQEAAADRYALDLCARAGFLPLAALPIFEVFATAEGEPGQWSDRFDHPPSACRVVDLWKASDALMRQDAGFMASLRADPRRRRLFEQMSDALKVAAGRSVADCKGF